MAGKFNDRYLSYNELRFARRILSLPLADIIDRIDSSTNEDRKISYLQKLMQIDLSQLLPPQLKNKLFNIIQQDLSNFNCDIFELSFNFHIKLIKTAPREYSTYCFKNTVHTLLTLSELQQQLKPKIDPEDPIRLRLIYLTKFALQIFEFITKDVLNYSDSSLIKVYELFISLLSKKHTKESESFPPLLPFDIVSCIDESSKWTRNIVFSFRTRKLFIECLSKFPEYTKLLFKTINDWYHSPNIPNTSDPVNVFLDRDKIMFNNFICSLCSIINICKFRDSNQLFPIMIDKKQQNVNFIFNTTIAFFKLSKSMYSIPQNIINFIAIKVGTIFNNDTCVDSILLDILFQEVHLWIEPFLIILSEISKCEIATIKLCYELSKQIQNVNCQNSNSKDQLAENLTVNPHCKYFCKVINCGIYGLLKGEEHSRITANCLISIFDNIFCLDFNCRSLLCDDQKLVPHILNYFKNSKLHGEWKPHEQPTVYRCLQKILFMVAFSPANLDLLRKENLLKEIMSNVDYNDIKWQNSLKFALYMSTLVLSPSELSLSERNTLITYGITELTALMESEDALDITLVEDEKQLLNIIYLFTHHLSGVISLFEIQDTDSESTLTETVDDYPLNMLDLISFVLNQSGIETRLQLFGLKVLKNIVLNLDACIYLQNHLNYMEKLQELQNQISEDHSNLNETNLTVNEILKLMFVESETYNNPDPILAEDSGIVLLLEETFNNEDCCSPEKIKDFLMSIFKLKFQGRELNDILNHFSMCLNNTIYNEDEILQLEEAEEVILSSEELIGSELVLRYGTLNGLIDNNSTTLDKFISLQKSVKNNLQQTEQYFCGFDWFLSTIFLMNEGDIERTQKCLTTLQHFDSIKLLWYKASFQFTGWECLDYVISRELPTLYFALENLGICCWGLCQTWARECFWRIMEWEQIPQLLVLFSLNTPDYVFYFFTSFLKENETEIVEWANDKSYALKLDTFKKYVVSDNYLFMQLLHEKYHSYVINILKVG